MTVNDNRVNVAGGTIRSMLIAGHASSSSGNATASGNITVISGNAEVVHATGAHAGGYEAANVAANGNSITVSGSAYIANGIDGA